MQGSICPVSFSAVLVYRDHPQCISNIKRNIILILLEYGSKIRKYYWRNFFADLGGTSPPSPLRRESAKQCLKPSLRSNISFYD